VPYRAPLVPVCLIFTGTKRAGHSTTSNKSYGDWGSIFADNVIASAILDRLLNHSTTINIKGESYRLKDKKKAGLIPQKLPGNEGAEPKGIRAGACGSGFALRRILPQHLNPPQTGEISSDANWGIFS